MLLKGIVDTFFKEENVAAQQVWKQEGGLFLESRDVFDEVFRWMQV